MSSEQRRAAIYLRISQDRENTRLGVDEYSLLRAPPVVRVSTLAR